MHLLSSILVADDSEAIRKAVRLAFQGFELTIFEAHSYVQALSLCKKSKPELLIADAALTGTAGPEDFHNLISASGQAYLLLLQGSFKPVDKKAFASLGLEHMISKPFGKDELFSALSGQLDIPVGPAGDRDDSSRRGGQSVRTPPPPPPVIQDETPTAGKVADADVLSQILESEIPLIQTRRAGLAPNRPSPSSPEGAMGGGRSPELYPSQGAGTDHGSANEDREIREHMKAEIRRLVREAVEEYCRVYFKPLLKELVTEELKKLAQEQSSQMNEL